ncbi:hypothetical protein D3C76_1534630 [compost metagenome]
MRVEQDDFGDFALSLVQLFEAALDLLQEISHAVHGYVLGSRMQPAAYAGRAVFHGGLSY